MNDQKEERVTIALRVPVTVKEKIVRKAKQSFRPLSSETEMLIMKGMEALYGEGTKEAA